MGLYGGGGASYVPDRVHDGHGGGKFSGTFLLHFFVFFVLCLNYFSCIFICNAKFVRL